MIFQVKIHSKETNECFDVLLVESDDAGKAADFALKQSQNAYGKWLYVDSVTRVQGEFIGKAK